MEALFDKTAIFIACAVLGIAYSNSMYAIVYVLGCLILTSFISLANIHHDKYRNFYQIICFLVYAILIVLDSSFLLFAPIFFYDTNVLHPLGFCFMVVLLFIISLQFSLLYGLAILCITFFALLSKSKTRKYLDTARNYIAMRDYNKEFMLHLEEKNQSLMERQDYEVNLATLNERNRIAREIHDSIGHQLTSAILQIGAILTISKDDPQKQQMMNIKQTLDAGMNSIRSSIHDLYEDSIDLENELRTLVDGFSFCPIRFQYNITSPLPLPIKYALLAITKEALTNVIKHSNASHCSIVLLEHPSLYQCRIEDNGTKSSKGNDGIGLLNMKERVNRLHGYIQINTDKGWQIFITLPKEENA